MFSHLKTIKAMLRCITLSVFYRVGVDWCSRKKNVLPEASGRLSYRIPRRSRSCLHLYVPFPLILLEFFVESKDNYYFHRTKRAKRSPHRIFWAVTPLYANYVFIPYPCCSGLSTIGWENLKILGYHNKDNRGCQCRYVIAWRVSGLTCKWRVSNSENRMCPVRRRGIHKSQWYDSFYLPTFQ